MVNKYFDLIDQSYYFPQESFDLEKDELIFNGIPVMNLIEKYGTPFKMTYLPRIGDQIKKAKNQFNKAMKSLDYDGKYFYCYCTKCCHFSYVLKEVLQHDVHLETSSAFDIDLIENLYKNELIDKDQIIVNNGYKPRQYLQNIANLINSGFKNVIPVCDNIYEVDRFDELIHKKCKIGLRVATEEEPSFEFYTSRLGIRSSQIVQFAKEKFKKHKKFELYMIHFFVDTGIKDTAYYWGELKKGISTYTELKKHFPSIKAINIGGGLPIRNSLGFEYDYKYMINQIVKMIRDSCDEAGVDHPDIFTEFGKYTVGESGATIFSVLEQKQQNDSEIWYMVDNSLMNTLPDSWGIAERFILLPINKWHNDYSRINIGGLSCDNSDYYNTEALNQQLFLPRYSREDKEPLFLGFFHTGAYQDALSGYGGIKHCLLPSPKHLIVDRDENGNLVDWIYSEEQTSKDMLKILGYN
ncbi:MAG: arginine decarboxylase [Saprospiraceae bacterium]|jgi:arginine decarboxylase|nr:arginine decarboxylase [Saprospiraceae bacterium]MBK8296926.1 arginine decarboxylase [Saprospiraceae bacterium]